MEAIKNSQWSTPKQWFLRFLFLYIVLYIYPYGFEYIQELDTNDISFWKTPTIWFGETILGWEFNKEVLLNGFDSKYDYCRFLFIGVLAVLGAVAWLFIDSRLKYTYNDKLNSLLKTIVRYHVGLTLIIYGLSKVLMLQFGTMDLNRLELSMGDRNGMQFLWAFMSYSKFYTMTTGWVEVIGGILVLFRRSTFMGAFILFIAMVNVVLIDIGYDVRVKMFAIHLFAMTLILLGNDIKRMTDFFIRNKSTDPAVDLPLFSTRKGKRIGYFLKGGLLLYFLISSSIIYIDRVDSQKNRYPTLTQSHEVTHMVINGDTLSASESNPKWWMRIVINGSSWRPEIMTVHKVGDQLIRYRYEADTLQRKINFYPLRGDKKDSSEWQYEEVEDNRYIFNGIHEGDTIWLKTKSKGLEDYLLTKDGIRWITDG